MSLWLVIEEMFTRGAVNTCATCKDDPHEGNVTSTLASGSAHIEQWLSLTRTSWGIKVFE